METYEVLERALALIEDERDWCQGDVETKAGARCALGAIWNIEEVLFGVGVWSQTNAEGIVGALAVRKDPAIAKVFGMAAGTFNDSHSHAEVIALFQEAIRNEKRKAGVLVDVPREKTEGRSEALA